MLSADNTDELRILLWGLTGAGKSNFIKQCGATAKYIDRSGQQVTELPEVGNGVNSSKSYMSCRDPIMSDQLPPETEKIISYDFWHIVAGRAKHVVLIDMPGFDDNELSESKNFELFALWLLDVDARYQRKPWLHGVIYVQPISSGHTKACKRCFDLLELVCGQHTIGNMSIVLTKGEGDTDNVAKVDAYKANVFSKYGNRVTLKVDKHRQLAAVACIEILWNCRPVRLQFLNEWERYNSFAMTSAGAFVDEDLYKKKGD